MNNGILQATRQATPPSRQMASNLNSNRNSMNSQLEEITAQVCV